MTNVRDALRSELRKEHDTLDRLMSGFDLTTATGLKRFLSSHWCAWDAMLRGKPGHRARAILTQRVEALRHDLAVFDHRPAPAGPLDAPDLAIAYVATGAQLGTEILRRAWQSASDARVRSASHFLSLPQVPGAWRALCEELAKIDADSRDGRAIVRGAKDIFDLFLSCTERELQRHETVRLD
ncbi:MAG: biliverdin-producing heme oxygenase [Roseivivax sp.]|nr:biliverdin-producing heme oxygenase [Roseivivax sp.]